MLKQKFLIEITISDLYSFYQNYMADDSTYQLTIAQETALNPDTNENISVTLINEASFKVQKLIILFAQVELGMNPPKLYFPNDKISYLNTMTILNQIAAAWKQNASLTVSLTDLPEYITQYDALTTINSTAWIAGLKEGIGISMLNNYFNGGKL